MSMSCYYLSARVILDNFYVDGIKTLTAILHVKSNAIIFAYLVNKTCVMNEEIFAIFGTDESEPLGLIEKLYCSFLHCTLLKNEDQR